MTIRRERVAPKESTPPKFRVVIPGQGKDEEVRIALNELPRQKPELADDADDEAPTRTTTTTD